MIQIVGCQQAVPLRPNVADLEEHIARQFSLDGQVVLSGILRSQLLWKFSEQQDGSECRPVNAAASRRIQYPVKRVGPRRCALIQEGSLEQRIGNVVAPP